MTNENQDNEDLFTESEDAAFPPSDGDESADSPPIDDSAAVALGADDADDPVIDGEHPAALFVDCASDPNLLPVLLREVEDTDCHPVVRRAYGDWRSAALNTSGWAAMCTKWGIEPVQILAHTQSPYPREVQTRIAVDATHYSQGDDIGHFFFLTNNHGLAPLALYLKQQGKYVVAVGATANRLSNPFFDLADHREILAAGSVTDSSESPKSPLEQTEASDTTPEPPNIIRPTITSVGESKDWWVPFVQDQCVAAGLTNSWVPLTKLGSQLKFYFPEYNPQVHGRLLQLIRQRLDLFDVHPDPNRWFPFPVTHHVKLKEQQLAPLPEPQPPQPPSRRPPPPYQPGGSYKTPRYSRTSGYDDRWDSNAPYPERLR
ncbi:MAG: NYN domain-containing protein [Chloroflexi bacterium]|nr:NYN domain-containing protein [Chloroflexota bacterium]MCY3697473.1 NYN domain-containing protein [Chloroflexota bacterium]